MFVRSFVSPLSLTWRCIFFSSLFFCFSLLFAVCCVVSIFTQPDVEAHPLAFSFVHSNCSRHYFFQHNSSQRKISKSQNLFDGKHLAAKTKTILMFFLAWSWRAKQSKQNIGHWSYKLKKKQFTVALSICSQFIFRTIITCTREIRQEQI